MAGDSPPEATISRASPGSASSRSAFDTAGRDLPTRSATWFLRHPKTVNQHIVAFGFFNWIQILTLQVFNQRQFHDLAVGRLNDHGRNFGQSHAAAPRASGARRQ